MAPVTLLMSPALQMSFDLTPAWAPVLCVLFFLAWGVAEVSWKALSEYRAQHKPVRRAKPALLRTDNPPLPA